MRGRDRRRIFKNSQVVFKEKILQFFFKPDLDDIPGPKEVNQGRDRYKRKMENVINSHDKRVPFLLSH